MRNYGPRAKGVFQKIIYPRIICYPGKNNSFKENLQ